MPTINDYIVVSDNPLIVSVDKIKDIKVKMIIIDGRIMYKSKAWK